MSTMDLDSLRRAPAVIFLSSDSRRISPMGGCTVYSKNFAPGTQPTPQQLASLLRTPESGRNRGAVQSDYVARGIGERVLCKALTSPSFVERVVQEEQLVPRLLMGSKKVVRESVQKVQIGESPLPLQRFSEEHSSDMRPASLIGYSALTRASGHMYMLDSHRDGGGRPGNIFDVGVVVPSRDAAELSAQIQADPRRARAFAAFVVRDVLEIEENEFRLPDYTQWPDHIDKVQLVHDMSVEPDAGILLSRA